MSHFDIERSADGQVFEKIGEQKATGNNSKYTYTDQNATTPNAQNSPFGGWGAYYRLKINDLDKKFTYSKVLSLTQQGKKTPLSIFPNPVHQSMTIQFETTQNSPTQTHDFIVTDLLGKIVFSKKINNQAGLNTLSINVSPIAAGIYFARLEDAFVRFVIQ